MDKGKLHHWWRVLRGVKTWQLVLLLLVFGLLSTWLLRQNNLGMIERRNLVKMADEQAKDVHKALANLQVYVAAHMNTSMGDKGVYLEHTYQKAYERAVQEAMQSGNSTNDIYTRADKECQTTFSKTASYQAYAQCVADKIAALGGGNDPLSALKAPATDLYRYNFISPLWTPDAAGIFVAITLFIAALLVARIVLFWVLYLVLKHRSR